MSPNTLISDVNEIQVGFFLANEKWFDDDAKRQLNLRATQITPEEYAEATAKAKIMAEEFIKWAKKNEYSGKIKNVWWTARPNIITKIVGVDVDQRKNPTDILVQFEKGPANGFLGLSAKSTRGKTDIGFKNPGVGTLDKNLKLNLTKVSKDTTEQFTKALSLPENSIQRKKYLRENPGIKSLTENAGSQLLFIMRNILLERLREMNQKDLLSYLLKDWMDADPFLYPPYVKVTGMGNKEPFSAMVYDPTKNEKIDALSKYKITLEEVGDSSIGVRAGTKKIMKIRFKYESEKLASSIKLSGDPW